ncbi:unnamed protein product [Urochloa decumbens]|uniref:DUF4220 domain-containing protein n=1 Tax=Urochloa decumbens TaxID=240449 RepID=A0ABC9AXU1_9POAL
MQLWKEWAVQLLVLDSFSLQAFLFIFAGTRRRNPSTVLRVLLWLAYLLADSTATFTLGHLSIVGTSRLHHLVAFWAPFLLLHLGGQDTITAYALEDNRLWLRHLQTLVVQLLGAAYVLCSYAAPGSRGAVVPVAAVLMFLVGAAKYGERVWALKCADDKGLESFDNYYGELTRFGDKEGWKNLDPVTAAHELEEFVGPAQEEKILHAAHILLGLCIRTFIVFEPQLTHYKRGVIGYFVCKKNIFRVVELELSLMYDILYTKARVIHTLYGACIRVVSLLAIVAALVLMFVFANTKDGGYNRVDVGITYLLLIEAFLMEITSGIMAAGSTWTRYYLHKNGWNRLHGVLVSIRRLVRAESWRSWSGTIGQLNMMDLCCLDQVIRVGDHTEMKMVLNELPPPLKIDSTHIEDLMLDEMLRVADKNGEAEDRMCSLNKNDGLPVIDADFDSRIIIGHIATNVILEQGGHEDEEGLHRATKALSDYMMFLLLMESPEMLPGASRRRMCDSAFLWLDRVKGINFRGMKPSTSLRPQFAQALLGEGRKPDDPYDRDKSPCKSGAELAKILLDKGWDTHHLLEVMFGFWVEMLCYAGRQCSKDSHARKLSRGGEFLTIVWLLTRHIAEYERFRPTYIPMMGRRVSLGEQLSSMSDQDA